ncbi:MAG: hypothetical protein NDJ19_04465 [Ramlibacter sp.]|nr:hypothetical protein [Ramlibacter sp.]
MTPGILAQLILVVLALAMALALRPWRMLRGSGPGSALATPLLATLTLLPCLWSLPSDAALPIALQWSGAPLLVLVLGWPLAIPVLAWAGLATVAAAGASWPEAVSSTVWLGALPATAVLLLGEAVRRTLGTHPAVYLLGRGFAVPMLALLACRMAQALAEGRFAAAGDEPLLVAVLLLSMSEAATTCTLASVLVAVRPRWLATWPEALYLGGRRAA